MCLPCNQVSAITDFEETGANDGRVQTQLPAEPPDDLTQNLRILRCCLRIARRHHATAWKVGKTDLRVGQPQNSTRPLVARRIPRRLNRAYAALARSCMGPMCDSCGPPRYHSQDAADRAARRTDLEGAGRAAPPSAAAADRGQRQTDGVYDASASASDQSPDLVPPRQGARDGRPGPDRTARQGTAPDPPARRSRRLSRASPPNLSGIKPGIPGEAPSVTHFDDYRSVESFREDDTWQNCRERLRS